jgi:hypothetical protein
MEGSILALLLVEIEEGNGRNLGQDRDRRRFEASGFLGGGLLLDFGDRSLSFAFLVDIESVAVVGAAAMAGLFIPAAIALLTVELAGSFYLELAAS